MYPVISLARLWKALTNEWAMAYQAIAAYAFPMISVSLPPKHNPTSRVRVRTSTSCDGPRDWSWQPHSSSPCLSASAVQGVYLGRLSAPRDEQIVRLTMLIEGARNLSPYLGFSRPWGWKFMGTPSAEDWPEALGSDVPALNSASSFPAKAVRLYHTSWDPVLSPGVTKSPPGHAPACQQNPPGFRGFLPCTPQN